MQHVTSRSWKPKDCERLRQMVQQGISPVRCRCRLSAHNDRRQDSGKKDWMPLPRCVSFKA
jgi:hypothetical protein